MGFSLLPELERFSGAASPDCRPGATEPLGMAPLGTRPPEEKRDYN